MACIGIVFYFVCYSPMQAATLYSKVWLSGTQQGEGRNFLEAFCDDDWESFSTTYPIKQLYYTFTSIILFFLPATIMIVFYLIIVRRLHGFEVPGETKSNIYRQTEKKVRNP
ncbi:hypothetical protein NPIL_167991 [Nephila pilipes]|uniref:G-protein coupled receptors family 1 profile domain-containing protein n=1 Tax=Nephila pilipes TaxID=299642 RepID=A0A8X6TSL4_NEPPI|nr:hypothetical protein NPIL_167991 [Nephila pilipes]